MVYCRSFLESQWLAIAVYSRLQNVGTRPGTMYAGFPSSLGFGVGGWSYSNFCCKFLLEKHWPVVMVNFH